MTGMKIAFCVFGINRATLQRSEFYRQDFEILTSLGHHVFFASNQLQLTRMPDLAFVWWWNYMWAWGPIARIAHIPVVTTGVFDLAAYDRLSSLKRIIKTWGSAFSDVSVFVSKDEYERVPRAINLRSDTVRYSPLVVDSAVYCPSDCPRFENGRIRIANVCWQRITNIRRKMVPELLEAFAVLAKEDNRLDLVLAGPPEDGQDFLLRRANELGVASRVSFPGELSREEKIQLMRSATVYCQVSRYEGFGVAIAEAMACGAPVLVSRVGAVPEVVGDCGTYVAETSVEGIVHGLRECLRDQEGIRRKAALGVRRIREQFSVERRRSDLKDILEQVVKRRKH